VELPGQRFPVGGQDGVDVLIGEAGEAGEQIAEVFPGIDAAAATTDDEGVEGGAAPTGVGMPQEQPVLFAQAGGPERILGQVMPTAGLCRVAGCTPGFSA